MQLSKRRKHLAVLLKDKMIQANYFLNDALRKSGDIHSANAKLSRMLEGYDLKSPAVVLPDFTDSNSLPVGTTAIIGSEQPINPALIGMDIGCGYQFFSADLNSRRFFKKRKLRPNAIKSVVNQINRELVLGLKAGSDLGTIGRGNHFIDMFVVDEVYNQEACNKAGLNPKKTYFLIHSGSRNKGFEVNASFSERFRNLNGDRETFNHDYLGAFSEARNYARLNRDILAKIVGEALSRMHETDVKTSMLFDKPHNDIQPVNGQEGVYKLKKGTAYLRPGEIFVIPSNAVDSAYVVLGLPGLEKSHFTINHGCGRRYTREQIFSKFRRVKFNYMFKDVVLNVDPKRMIEEIPKGYKHIGDVVDAVEEHGLARRIAKLIPVGVIVERKQERRK